MKKIFMKKFLLILSLSLMVFACSKSNEVISDEIAFNDAIVMTETITPLTETSLSQTATVTMEAKTASPKMTKEEIKSFIKGWLTLSKEEKKAKFSSLTKQQKKILFIFHAIHKKQKGG
jgi:hypothetical protein